MPSGESVHVALVNVLPLQSRTTIWRCSCCHSYKSTAFSLDFPYPSINAKASRTQMCKSKSSSVHLIPLSSSLPDNNCEFWWWGGKQEEMAGTIKQETVFNIEKKLCIWKLLAPNCQNKKNSLSFYNTHPSPQFCGKSYQHKDTAMPFTCWKVFPNFNVKAVRV